MEGEKTFYVHSESFYAKAAPLRRGVEEIMIGVSADDGGTYGEFALRWFDLGGKPVPKLEAFEDSWEVLFDQCGDFLAWLREQADLCPTPAETKAALLKMGYRDTTSRADPDHPHRCGECGQIVRES